MILDLRLPGTVTARALTQALRRAFDHRTGLRLAYARAHGLSLSDVSRALHGRHDRPDADAPLRRVAAVQGFLPHPAMPGHYRRAEPVPEVDPELERMRAEARAESENLADHLSDDERELQDLAACERFLNDLDDDVWRRAAELDLTSDDLAYLAAVDREEA